MRSAVLLTLVLILLGWPGVAAAGTTRVEDGTLVYEANAGEVNDVVVAYFTAASLNGVAEYRIGEVDRIRYPKPGITPLAGCRTHINDPPHIAACPAEGVARIVINLGDGPDRVRTLGDYRDDPDRGCDPVLVYSGDNIPVPVRFDGGSGDDELFEGPYMVIGPPLIGPQRCTLPRGPRAQVTSYGGAGDDLIVNAVNGYGGSGADSIEAPSSRRTSQDGGGGGDVLLGGSGADALDGAGGDDIVDGGPGDDSIAGGPGGDLGEGGTGDDILLGGPGADELNGLQGNDRIVGGPGWDILEGDAGADLLDAGDARRDDVSGGAGRDRAMSDRRDRLRGVERR